jgi:hypothetical protein
LKSNFGNKNEIISANNIGNYLFFLKNKKITDSNNYESFKRKNRGLFNVLENNKFIKRKDLKKKEDGGKPDFIINNNFLSENNLFKD